MKKIAILGGTGSMGQAICQRLLHAQFSVIIGTRHVENKLPIVDVCSYQDSVEKADIVIFVIPYQEQQSIARIVRPFLKNQLIITAISSTDIEAFKLGSAAKQLQQELKIEIVSALQTIPSSHMKKVDQPLETLCFGNDLEQIDKAIDFFSKIKINATHAGNIENSLCAESLVSSLIFLNAKYKPKKATIHINVS